jgi:hypothetical protein
MAMADEAEEFWSAFEKETGERVEARAMGEFFRANDYDAGFWGLLILTDKSFRFKHMPGENWLASLFKRQGRAPARKEPVEVTIARGDILSVDLPKRGFFGRLFGPAFPRFAIAARESQGEGRYLFSVDPSNGFLAALEKAAGGGQDA